MFLIWTFGKAINRSFCEGFVFHQLQHGFPVFFILFAPFSLAIIHFAKCCNKVANKGVIAMSSMLQHTRIQ